MNLQELKQKHEKQLEIIEFLEYLEKREKDWMESNVAHKRIFYTDSELAIFKLMAIKRCRYWVLNKYNQINK